MTNEQDLRQEAIREANAAILVGEAKGAPAISYALGSNRVRAAFDALEAFHRAPAVFEGDEAEVIRQLRARAGDPLIADALALLDAKDAEIASAKQELGSLMDSIWRAEFRKQAPEWKPLDDLPGMVSQMDNMYAGVRGQRDAALARAEQAECERDEAREQFDNHVAWASDQLAQAEAALAERDKAIAEAWNEAHRVCPTANHFAFEEVHKVVSHFRPFLPKPKVDPLVMLAREMVVADGVIRTGNQANAIREGRAGHQAAEEHESRLRTALAAHNLEIRAKGE